MHIYARVTKTDKQNYRSFYIKRLCGHAYTPTHKYITGGKGITKAAVVEMHNT